MSHFDSVEGERETKNCVWPFEVMDESAESRDADDAGRQLTQIQFPFCLQAMWVQSLSVIRTLLA